MGHRMVASTDEQIERLVGDVTDEFDAEDEIGDVQPMEPDEIIEAVRCVTKLSDEEDYEEYIGRCATNPLAIAVKIHDLTDNMDVRRMPCIGEKEISRLKKYLKAYHRLMPFYMNH